MSPIDLAVSVSRDIFRLQRLFACRLNLLTSSLFEHLTKLILSSVKRVEAKRAVVDSVAILSMQYPDKFFMRQGLQGMVQALENSGVASLILSEHSENEEIPLEWFVTSGIIHLHHTRVKDTVERTIQITKMRGIKQ